MSDKIKRYDMRTLGGGSDYSHHESEDGEWCCTDDVAALEADLTEARSTNYYQQAAQAKFKLKESRELEKKVADALVCHRVSSIQTALELRDEVKRLRAELEKIKAIGFQTGDEMEGKLPPIADDNDLQRIAATEGKDE